MTAALHFGHVGGGGSLGQGAFTLHCKVKLRRAGFSLFGKLPRPFRPLQKSIWDPFERPT
jgi:hypothetical protein